MPNCQSFAAFRRYSTQQASFLRAVRGIGHLPHQNEHPFALVGPTDPAGLHALREEVS